MSKIKNYLFLLGSFIALAILMPSVSLAVELGNLNVNSKLGENLDLELGLLSVMPVEIGTMEVGLASRSDFARAEVIYPENANLLNFDVVEGDDGQYFVTITSEDPVNDTYLHLLILANWSGGKVVREYTALLDPPLYTGTPASSVEVASTGEASDTSSTTSVSSSSAYPSSITVQRGDTLSGIVARLNAPDSVSLYQGLTSLLEANPDAFVDGNMNRLKAGAELNIPTFPSMAQINRQTALQNFTSQVAEYDQYLVGIGLPALDTGVEEQVANIPSVDTDSDAPETTTDIDDSEEDVSEVSEESEIDLNEVDVNLEAEQDDEVRLSIGQEASDEDASAIDGSQGDEAQVDALKSQLAEIDESLLASGVESEEVKQRLRDIQTQVDRVSKLFEIEDANLAVSQDRAASDDDTDEAVAAIDETGQVDDGGEAGVVDAEVEDTSDSETASISETTETDSVVTAVTEADTDADAATTEEIASVADTTAQTVADTSTETESTAERQVLQTGIMDTLTRLLGSFSDYTLKIVAGLITLIALLFFYRRRKSQKEFEEGMLDIESGQVSTNSDSGQRSFKQLSTVTGVDLASGDSGLELSIGGGMSYLSEDGIAGVAEEENEVVQAGAVDPMAEADVYLAYDRDEQAIQVLKEAYSSNPERAELAEKLLEIYHKQDDRIAFDALATELHARIGAKQNPVWTKVMAMGKEVSPDSDIYNELSELSELPAVPLQAAEPEQVLEQASTVDISSVDDIAVLNLGEEEVDISTGLSEDTAIKTLELDDLELSLSDDESPVDRALDAPTLSQIITNAEEQERQSQMESELEKMEPANTGEIEFKLGEERENEDNIEIEVEESSELANALAQLDSEVPKADEDSYLSEASKQSISKLEPYHESETALELAKAYLELGEKDIAKGFIEEVVNEGSTKQKAKAEKLVKELVE